jgi:hypothetical protein
MDNFQKRRFFPFWVKFSVKSHRKNESEAQFKTKPETWFLINPHSQH